MNVPHVSNNYLNPTLYFPIQTLVNLTTCREEGLVHLVTGGVDTMQGTRGVVLEWVTLKEVILKLVETKKGGKLQTTLGNILRGVEPGHRQTHRQRKEQLIRDRIRSRRGVREETIIWRVLRNGLG